MFSCNIDTYYCSLLTHILAHTRGVVDRLGYLQHSLQHSLSDSRSSGYSHPQALAVCPSRSCSGFRDAVANKSAMRSQGLRLSYTVSDAEGTRLALGPPVTVSPSCLVLQYVYLDLVFAFRAAMIT